MAKPILAVDIDDVLFPFVAALFADHNRRYGTSLSASDVGHFDFNILWGGTLQEAIAKVHDFLERDNLSVAPVRYSQEVLGRLSSVYELVALTARAPMHRPVTEQWLDRHFAGVFSELILVGNHYAGGDVRTKAEVCLEIGAACIVDDSHIYIGQCASAGVFGILFGDHGWNREAELPDGAVRGRDWLEAEAHLWPMRRQVA